MARPQSRQNGPSTLRNRITMIIPWCPRKVVFFAGTDPHIRQATTGCCPKPGPAGGYDWTGSGYG
ncbi:hypothetical protein GCM10010112_26120 [Actinoplanes lobatus]|nr:hypothetical protein GCM10010112_26120 [Actinoplanes lobatus]